MMPIRTASRSVSAGGRSGPTGGPTGDGSAPRIAVGGGVARGNGGGRGDVTADGQDTTGDSTGTAAGGATGYDAASSTGDVAGDVAFGDPDPAVREEPQFAAADFGDEQIEPEVPVSVEGPFIDDGRPPQADDEVAIGARIAATIGAEVGDDITLEPTGETFRVAGIGRANDGDDTDVFVVTTMGGLERLGSAGGAPQLTAALVRVGAAGDSTMPFSPTSLVTRDSRLYPKSVRAISRPRNWTVALTLSPSPRKRMALRNLKS